MVKDRLAQLKADAKREGWAHYILTPSDELAMMEGCRFDMNPATNGQHVIDFMRKYLRHSKGEWAGKPFIPDPWQCDGIIMPLFSWKRENGLRRFNKAEIWIPKKNGKSSLAAALSVYALAGDNEAGAEVYCAAVDRLQAGIVFGESANMIAASPVLSGRMSVIRSTKTVNYGNASWLRALSADVPTKEGLNASWVDVDELHAHPDRKLFATLMHSGRARRQPMLFIISTAGDSIDGIGYEEYDYAKQILEGKTKDTRTFAYIREAPKDSDWTSPLTWRTANPALGIIFSEERMAQDCAEAKQSPLKQGEFKRYLLNIWIHQAEAWLNYDKWTKGAERIDPETLVGRPCYGGIDLSQTTDITAFALFFPKTEADKAVLLTWFWLPADNIEDRESRDKSPYRDWADRNYITLTPGETIDYAFVMAKIAELTEKFNPLELGYDPYAIEFMRQGLEEKYGITNGVEIPQNFLGMSNASKEFDRLILEEEILHSDNPIMNKMVAQVRALSDTNGNLRPAKNDRKKNRQRIDGVVAAVMAIARALIGGGESVYEKQDLMVI